MRSISKVYLQHTTATVSDAADNDHRLKRASIVAKRKNIINIKDFIMLHKAYSTFSHVSE